MINILLILFFILKLFNYSRHFHSITIRIIVDLFKCMNFIESFIKDNSRKEILKLPCI